METECDLFKLMVFNDQVVWTFPEQQKIMSWNLMLWCNHITTHYSEPKYFWCTLLFSLPPVLIWPVVWPLVIPSFIYLGDVFHFRHQAMLNSQKFDSEVEYPRNWCLCKIMSSFTLHNGLFPIISQQKAVLVGSYTLLNNLVVVVVCAHVHVGVVYACVASCNIFSEVWFSFVKCFIL